MASWGDQAPAGILPRGQAPTEGPAPAGHRSGAPMAEAERGAILQVCGATREIEGAFQALGGYAESALEILRECADPDVLRLVATLGSAWELIEEAASFLPDLEELAR